MARTVAAWRSAESLWQRRATCVAFVPLAAEASAHYPESPARVEATCEALVADRARFAQTAVGWTLRELARSEPERVEAFVERYLGSLSL